VLSCQQRCKVFVLKIFRMPIAVRDFEWQQSDQMLYITVPLKGVSRNKVDILSTEVYIKVGLIRFKIHRCYLDKISSFIR